MDSQSNRRTTIVKKRKRHTPILHYYQHLDPLSTFSYEVLLRILKYLHVDDVLRFGRTSKHYHVVSQDESCWRYMFESYIPIKMPCLTRMAFKCQRGTAPLIFPRRIPTQSAVCTIPVSPFDNSKTLQVTWRDTYRIEHNWIHGNYLFETKEIEGCCPSTTRLWNHSVLFPRGNAIYRLPLQNQSGISKFCTMETEKEVSLLEVFDEEGVLVAGSRDMIQLWRLDKDDNQVNQIISYSLLRPSCPLYDAPKIRSALVKGTCLCIMDTDNSVYAFLIENYCLIHIGTVQIQQSICAPTIDLRRTDRNDKFELCLLYGTKSIGCGSLVLQSFSISTSCLTPHQKLYASSMGICLCGLGEIRVVGDLVYAYCNSKDFIFLFQELEHVYTLSAVHSSPQGLDIRKTRVVAVASNGIHVWNTRFDAKGNRCSFPPTDRDLETYVCTLIDSEWQQHFGRFASVMSQTPLVSIHDSYLVVRHVDAYDPTKTICRIYSFNF